VGGCRQATHGKALCSLQLVSRVVDDPHPTIEIPTLKSLLRRARFREHDVMVSPILGDADAI
jgi:hypothetical protein